jgi:hypothetical protein
MFEEIKDGTKVKVHGLNCWLPPVGYGYHIDPEQAKQNSERTGLTINLLEKVDVIKRSSKRDEQYWERPTLPEDLLLWRDEELERKKTDPNWQHPELMKFVRREWNRRLYGVWFYNDGTPTYLTGSHYFYLTYWRIATTSGWPDYRKIDKDYFYFWQYCVEDPKCRGILEIQKRRNGKTDRSCCIAVEIITRSAESHCGIQSKTKDDAASLFQLKLVPSFKELPFFFKPEYDQSKGDSPKEEIRLFRTSKKGKVDRNYYKAPELKSTITLKESGAKAYDGLRLKIYIGDESAKTKVKILDRHKVVQYCCMDNRRRIIGKMIITSTVEEIGCEYGFDKLWEQSNQYKREKDGTTTSGLYKIFTPAQYSGDYDIYGEPLVEETIIAINAQRDKYRDSVEQLNDIIRKEPMTEEEAFFVSAKRCHFNPQELNYRLSDLSVMKNYSERGNFSWVERDKKVEWTKDPTGRWEICWLFENEGQSNNVMKRGNKFIPNNELYFITGCDPFDHDQVEDDSSRSKGAAFTLMRHNPYKDETPYNNAFVCKYHARPELAHIFYEDMIMQCFYYGSKLLVENQKPGIMKYFDTRGYKDFLVHFGDRKEPGIPSSPENKILMLEATQLYLKDNTNKVFFKDLIGDWLKFDISNTQKYDLSMAAGWTLFANTYNAAKKGSSGLKDITKLFRRYAA